MLRSQFAVKTLAESQVCRQIILSVSEKPRFILITVQMSGARTATADCQEIWLISVQGLLEVTGTAQPNRSTKRYKSDLECLVSFDESTALAKQSRSECIRSLK